MAKKLFVGGLSFETTEDRVRELFEQAGTVDSVAIISDKMTGRPKGFGFVEMGTEEEAAKAMEMFNGQEFEGRSLTVNEARPQEERPRDRGFDRGNRGNRDFRDRRQGGRGNW